MQFTYRAKDEQGKLLEAVAQADSASGLRTKLSSQGLEVIYVRPVTGVKSVNPVDQFLQRFDKAGLKDMVVFSRQFSSMIGAGVAMLRTLTIMCEQCESPKLKRTLDGVRRSVEAGQSLSDSLSKYPDVFDRLYVSMVRAGEAGGILDGVLKRLADFLEARAKLEAQVKSAMAYPSVVLVVAILVFWGMLTFILPIFQKMFTGVGAELPAYTQFLINLSGFMRSIWMFLFVAAVVAAVIGLKAYYKTEPGRLQIDQVLLRLPVMGDLIRKVAVARFSRTFGTLIRSGVPMLSALEVVKDTSGNAVLAASVDRVSAEVRQGGNVSKQMTKDGVFPPMVIQMIAVGEETGRLDEMLEKIADFYDVEVENSVEALTSVLEPIMVVFIGGIVGSVVVGMYLPIFTIINQIK